MKSPAKRPGIICVGNADRADDAVGPVCADMLSSHGLPVRVCPGDAFELLELFRSSAAVFLVDAVVTGKEPPGTIYSFSGDSAAIKTASWTCSTHGMGVAEALRLARTLGVCPSRVCLYGVEAARFDWGEEMTPEVAAALPALVARIEADWRQMTDAGNLK
jgi:hydrogenase maturation protease